MDNMILQLITRLDSSKTADDIKKIQEQLNAKGVTLTPVLDTATSKKEIQNLAKQLQTIMSSIDPKFGEIGVREYTSAINSTIAATKKAASEQDRFVNSMAKGREQSELLRSSEDKRQQLAQNNAINKALESEYLERQKISQKIDEQASKIKNLQSSGNIDLNFEKAKSSIMNLDQMGLATESLKNDFKQLNTLYKGIDDSTPSKLITTYSAFDSQLKKVNSSISTQKLGLSEVKQQISQLDKITLSNQIQAWRRVNSAAEKEFGSTLDGLLIKLREVDNKTDFSNLQKQFRGVKSEADALGVTGKSLTDTFGSSVRKFAEWTVSAGAFMSVIQMFRQMITNVIELNTAMTSLYKVTDETDSKYRQFLKNANKDAQELGRSVSSLVEQSANWAKLGFSIDQSAKLAKTSSIYANVGEVDDSTSVSDLVTAMKAFNITASDSIKIVDIYNKLGNEFAVSSKDIGEGVKNSASALALQGNTIEQTVAMLTGGGEITQEVGELGNMLKVASLRLASMKGQLEEIGEEYEDINSISKNQTQIYNMTKGQVDILDEQNGKLKSTYQILEEVSKAWKDVDDLDKPSLLELMFGKQRANQGAAILTAFQSGQVQKALSASLNANGSAQQEQDRWIESIDAKLQQFTASFQTLSSTVVNSDALKTLIDSGITLNNVLNSIIQTLGLFPTAVSAIGIGVFVKNFQDLKNAGIAATALREFNLAVSAGNTSNLAYANILKTVDTQTKINIISQSSLTEKQKLGALSSAGLGAEEIKTAVSTGALTTAQTTAKVSTIGLSTALKGLWATMLANPLLMVGMAVTAGVAAWNAYKQSIEEMRQKTSEATNSFVESSKSIDDNAKKYKTLHDELTNANTTEERQKQIKEELLNLQKDLNDKYGEEHGKINLVTDAYKDQTQAIRELNKETAQKFLNENTKGLDDAESQMTSKKGYNIFGQDVSMYSDQGKDILDVAKRLGLKTDTDESTGSFTIRLKADPTVAYKQINDFMNEVTLLQEKYGKDDSFIATMLGASSAELNKAKAIIDDVGETYNSRLIAEIQASNSNVLSEGYAKAKDAVDKYNDAITSGDDSKIEDARNSLNNVKNSIDLTSDDWKRYSGIMTNVFDQASTGLYDFRDAINSNQDGIKNLTSDLKGMSKEELLAMADDGQVDNFDKLVEVGKKYGLTAEDVVSVLQKLKLVQNDVAQSGVKAFEPLSKEDLISNINSLSTGFESLDKIMNSMKDKNPFNYALLDDKNFKETFSGLGEEYTKFIETISSSPNDVKSAQSAFDSLTTAWLDSSGVLNNLTEENSNLAIAMLKNMGVANAEEVVTSRLTIAQEHLAAQKAYTSDVSDALSNATASEIPNLIDEATQSDIAKVALAGLAIEKANVNGTALDTSGDIENIIALTGVVGSANRALKALNALKSGNLGYGIGSEEDYKSLVAAAQKEVDDAIKEASEYKGKGANTNINYSGGTKTNKVSGKEKSKKDPTQFDWITVSAERAQKSIDKLQTQINDTSNWKPKNDLSDTAISEMSRQIEALQAQADAYQEKANSFGLSPSYIDKIKNGALEIESITDEVIAKNVKGYQDAYNKAEDFRDKIDDVKKAMKELAQSKLDNIINDFSSLVSLMEKYSSYNKSLIELQKDLGEEISSTDYEKLIDQQKGIYDELQNKYRTLSDELHNAVSNGAIKVGSQEWRKYNEELIDVNNSMNDVVSNMNDFRKSMIGLPFEELERITDATSRVNNEISTMLGLIGSDGLVDGGMPTSKGLARLALLGKQLANAKQETANYGEAIEAVEEAYSNGTLTQAEYNERINEYSSAQMSAVNATKEAQDAILQFRYDAIQAEIDDMNKLIDAKKKALQSEKEYQDYLDEINGKQNDISNLQKKIDELSLSTDRRDIAQRLQLEEDMAKAKEELAKIQADNAYNKTLESLDKQGEEFEKSKNNELETLKSNTDAQEKVIKDYLGQVKDNYKTVYSTLTKYGTDYNITMTEELTSPWDSAGSAVETFQSAVSDAIAQINIDIANIDLSKLTELVSTMSGFSANGSGASFEDVTGSGSWQKTSKGWWYGNSNDDYVSDGVYTIGGKQYNFNEDGYMKTGWDESTGTWRFFDPENGQMVKSNWRKGSDGKDYYLKSDGTMATDMAIKSKSENGYYYVGNDGAQEGGLISYDDVKQRKLTVGYKNGTTDSKPGLKKVYEEGPELIITGDGVALNSVGHDVIFTKAMTDNLRNIAIDPTEFILGNMPKFDVSKLGGVNKNENFNIDVDFHIQGNADEDALSKCRDIIITELPKIIREQTKQR